MDVIKNPNATFIDLRNQDELDTIGFIEKAKHIPLMDIPSRLEEIKSYSKPIVLFCASGNRAERALEFLEANGVEEVYNAGGYHDIVEIQNQ